MFRSLVIGFLFGALCLMGVVAPAPPARAAATAYPVPTASAGLGRIVTIPASAGSAHFAGSMVFIEKDAQKLGQVYWSGTQWQIAEFAIGGSTQYSQVMDVDVAGDGTIWVLVDQGRKAMRFRPWITGPGNVDYITLSSNPVGKRIRVSASGTPWITWNYDTEKIVSINPATLAVQTPVSPPACGPNLAVTATELWCQAWSPGADLIRVGAGGSGGTPFPQSGAGRDVYALSPGPVGSVWYARHAGGTMTSSPWLGGVGYLNATTGVYREFNTGERTAPESLVQQNGIMWFTSLGPAKGIGHLDATGHGALTQVGGYRPTALTVGSDGAIWFTDATTNVIVRVPVSDLQTTNVDPGAGSVFAAAQPPTIVKQTPGVTVKRAHSSVKRGKTAAFTVRVKSS
ncbi:MAG: hypothetical protein J0H64_01390, partial [Actinobacteria bacterium]|nr:hypothetical protein [Actinomycetota bacterium]